MTALCGAAECNLSRHILVKRLRGKSVARVARFTEALPVYVTPEVRRRLDKLASDHRVSLAEVIRDIIDVGLDDAELRWNGLEESDE